MSTCPACGSDSPPGTACVRCLLATGHGGHGDSTKTERIFRIALSYAPAERRDFFKQASGDAPALLEELELLLEAYEEEGGDAAAATLVGTQGERWAAVKREAPGSVIDHFRLVKVIGEGGMGSVWEAEQNAPIKRRVALKIIKLGMDTAEVVKRFERERRTLALMAHPHIAQVYEAGATPAGRPYFAMEMVDGTAITRHCAQAGLTLRDRLTLFLEVCSAVEHAHQKGVIHRDLKPSNILVAGGAVKVIDFGIAKATQETSDGLLTLAAQVLGTPAYMSPEQAESNGTDVDTRTDVYSLGVVLYELLCGALPFDPARLASTHLVEVQRILREEEPPRPSTRLTPPAESRTRRSDQTDQSDLPTSIHPQELRNDLDWIVMKALSKERDRRYPSAATFAADVQRFLNGEAVTAVPPTLAYRFGKFVRRNKAAVAAVAGIVLALTAALIVSLQQVQRANQALAGEAAARVESQLTVADLYTRTGLISAEKGEHARAALWFAEAARISAADPARASANQLRAAAWTAECRVPAAGFQVPFKDIEDIVWHPGGRAFILCRMDGGGALLWDADREALSPLVPPDADAAAWDAAGTHLAVVAGEKVIVMEYPGGKVLAEHAAEKNSAVALSPDGRLVAVGGTKPFLWEWKANLVRSCAAVQHTKRIRWSTDGRYSLWQNLTRVAVVDTETPGQLRFPPLSNMWKTLVHFAGETDTFFHSDRDTKQTFLRKASTGEIVREVTGGSDFALTISEDARYVAFGQAPLWSARTGNRRKNPIHRDSEIMEGAAFSPDGSLLATSGYDAKVLLWDVANDRAMGEIGTHQHPIQCVSWSPDGSLLASAQNGVVRVWQIKNTALLQRVPAAAPTLAALSPDGRYMAASGRTVSYGSVRSTRVHEISTGQLAGPELVLDGLLMDAAFTGETEIAMIVSTTSERQKDDWNEKNTTGHLELRNWRTGERVAGPISMPSEPRGLAVHPAGTHVGVSGSFGEGLEWERATGTLRTLLPGGKMGRPFGTLTNGRCAYAGGGRFFAAWGTLGVFHVYDRSAGRGLDLHHFTHAGGDVHDVGFYGSFMTSAISGDVAPHLSVMDLTTGERIAPLLPHSDWMYLSRFDETGQFLLTTGRRPMAQVWDWRAGRLVCPALPHVTDTMAGVFVPGTPWVLTGSLDGLVRFWDRRSGMLIRPPIQMGGQVLQLSLTPDALWLVAGGMYPNPGLAVIDLERALTAGAVPSVADAELTAAAIIHEGGGIVPLTSEQWLEKWRDLRARERAAPPSGGGSQPSAE